MLAKRELHLPYGLANEPVLSRGVPQPPKPARVAVALKSIWRRRGLVLVLTALALIPAILYVQLARPLFTATTTLMLHRTLDGAAQAKVGQPAVLGSDELAAQSQVVVSAPVLAAALAGPGVSDSDPLRNHRDSIDFLRRCLEIKTDTGGLITISIDSGIPDDASRIAAAVAQAYSQMYSSLRQNGSSDALTALRKERAGQQAQLTAKSADLLRFGEEHHVGTGEDPAVYGASELTSLSDAVNEAHVAAVETKSSSDDLDRQLASDPQRMQRLKWYEESSPASSRAGNEDPESIRQELTALKSKELDLSQKLMPGNPTLARVHQRIDELGLAQEAAVHRRAAAAQQHEADLQHAYEEAQKQVLDRTTQQAEFARKSGEVSDLQKAVDTLDERIAAIDVADNAGTPDVTVLDPAKASTEPTSPNRQRILLLSAIGGLLFSSLLAMWLERSRQAVSPQVLNGLNLPILAELPVLPTDYGPMSGGDRPLRNAGPALEEILHRLRSVVQGAAGRGRGAIVLISSPSRGDGKSTLASNLAVSLAMTHKRVLLVDGDLRGHSQSKIFGIGNATGLATLLEAEVSIPITAIHHTGLPSLDVIPAGPSTRNPSELFNSQRFIDLLGDLAERYDYVLIDSPPAVTYSDARIISASCDMTMLVVGTHQLNRRLFQIAVDGLTAVGANLCGVVLNSSQNEERCQAILGGAENSKPPEPEPVEVVATRKLAGAMLTAARAIDLVRTPPTNPRVIQQLALPNGQSASKRSNGHMLEHAAAPAIIDERK